MLLLSFIPLPKTSIRPKNEGSEVSNYTKYNKYYVLKQGILGTSLVVQWLRICPAMQGRRL